MLFTEALSKQILILDGGMGTLIQRQGIKSVDNEQLNLTHPEVIESIHRQYIAAGADIIETNSFGANRLVQKDFCLQDQACEMAFEAARIARRAADSADRQIFVAGSVGPTGKSLSFVSNGDDPAFRECDFDEFALSCKEQISALIRGGVDCILLETCYDALNTKAAICAIQELGAPVPVIISVTVSDLSGRTLTGQTLDAFYNSVRHCPNLIAFGINCALGAREMIPMVREIASFSDLPLIFYPNAGLPDRLGQYCETPQTMAESIKPLVDEGIVNIIGGCCGTTPEHIRAISRLRSAHSQELFRRAGNGSVRSSSGRLTVSGLKCVKIDKSQNFTNIGERTNVAGSKKFARLISENNFSEALQVALDQIRDGARIIDINMDDPMVDSKAKMRQFLRHIAGEPEIAQAALMIDSSHWETLLEGLKNAQGRCIVNSISLKEGEDEFLRKARAIHSFGAAMVVMAFDEEGQAVTFDRKIEICRRSYDLLTGKGAIPPQDIIFDCNILSIGTGIAEHSRFGMDFIEAVRWIKRNLPGAYTSGGLSNLSFAFRGNNRVREAMHSVFLFHAIEAGLDMAIVNPGMLQIYDEIDPQLRIALEDVIFDHDPQATSRLVQIASHISEEGDSPAASQKAEMETLTLDERLIKAIIHGEDCNLERDLKQAVDEGRSALSIIEGVLLQGMEQVGKAFAEGKMFLPQVVKSARTMQEAVAHLKPYIGGESESAGKPKFLIATVQGDVHDIGKNIVAILLRCSGFEVIDLGVMVPCQDILERAIAENVDFIGLSGLITPSLHYMEEICKLLSERNMQVPLIVGGAATSQLHTSVKLAKCYDYVLYGGNASDTAVLAKRLLQDPEEQMAQIHAQQEKIRALHSEKKERIPTIKTAGKSVPPATFKDIPVTDLTIAELEKFFDWNLYRAVCNIKGTSPELLEEGREWLRKCHYSLRVTARFFDCRREGDELVGRGIRIPFLHAQSSLLDHFAEGAETQMGTFAVRLSGSAETDLVRHAVMVTLAEAGAEWLRDSLRSALPRGMQLITPGIGYSCLPDHTLKRDILSLLPQEMEISLTPTCAMIPEASICGLILAGEEMDYRDPKGVTSGDIEDYARRRNLGKEDTSILYSICSTFTH